MAEVFEKRKMLISYLLLLISSQHIGAEAVYCIKKLQCNVTKCFKMRDSENAVCSSIQKTEHCSISGTRIKLKCDVQLHCFCNEEGPFELDDAEAVYCIKKLQCNVTKCFTIRDSENGVSLFCSSIQQTEHCSISGTHIKLKCEAQLHCFCNEEGPFELDEFPELPVKDQSSISMENEVHPERNNTNRTESSGSSMTQLQIAAAVAVPVLAALLVFGAIAYCVWKAGAQRHRHRRERPQSKPLAEDQNE